MCTEKCQVESDYTTLLGELAKFERLYKACCAEKFQVESRNAALLESLATLENAYQICCAEKSQVESDKTALQEELRKEWQHRENEHKEWTSQSEQQWQKLMACEDELQRCRKDVQVKAERAALKTAQATHVDDFAAFEAEEADMKETRGLLDEAKPPGGATSCDLERKTEGWQHITFNPESGRLNLTTELKFAKTNKLYNEGMPATTEFEDEDEAQEVLKEIVAIYKTFRVKFDVVQVHKGDHEEWLINLAKVRAKKLRSALEALGVPKDMMSMKVEIVDRTAVMQYCRFQMSTADVGQESADEGEMSDDASDDEGDQSEDEGDRDQSDDEGEEIKATAAEEQVEGAPRWRPRVTSEERIT